MTDTHAQHASSAHMGKSHYGRLGVMVVLSFLAMYVLMYAMVNVVGNAHPNWNQFYMAGLMTAAMVVIEMALMRSMYRNKRVNLIIVAASVATLILLWLFVRLQTGISDRQFLKSMIPHHAGAILMCQEASVRDAEVQRLCEGIVASQQAEIDQMNVILRRLER